MTATLLALALVAAEPTPAPTLRVGDQLRLYAPPDGAVPLVDSEEHYRGFLRAIRAGKFPWGWLTIVTIPGRLVEIVSLKDDPTYALPAPAAEVRIAEGYQKGDVLWVAQQYLRPRGEALPLGEVQLPTFVYKINPRHVNRPGDVLNLFATDRRTIPCAVDRAALTRLQAALAEQAKAGGEARPIEGEGILQISINSLVEMLGRSPARGPRWLAVRVVDRPHKGRVVYVPERFAVFCDVRMIWPKGWRRR